MFCTLATTRVQMEADIAPPCKFCECIYFDSDSLVPEPVRPNGAGQLSCVIEVIEDRCDG